MPAFQYSNLPILGQASDVAAGGIVQSFNEIYTFLTNPNISSSLLDASALNASVPVGIIVPMLAQPSPACGSCATVRLCQRQPTLRCFRF